MKSDAVTALEDVEEQLEFHLIRFEQQVNWSDKDYGVYLGLSVAYQFVLRAVNKAEGLTKE